MSVLFFRKNIRFYEQSERQKDFISENSLSSFLGSSQIGYLW